MKWILIVLVTSALCAQEIDLRPYEKRLISQNGEDGILEKIFRTIGTTSKYYVEFGAGDGHNCSNTEYLREKYGWTGLLLEGRYPDDPTINLHREFLTAENICSLFEKYQVPPEFDFISIDIDNNDFYLWKALSEQYRPRVVLIEFNSWFDPTTDKVIKYVPFRTENDQHSGASILAFYNLGKRLGYSLVYQESAAVNLVFIRDDVLQESGATFKHMNDVAKLYTGKPGPINLSGFTSSEEVLK
jgi:hypothetical protein